MKTSKTALLSASMALALCAAGAANAGDIILFDPDGAGGTFTAQNIDAFDWLQGNALALDGNLSALTPGSTAPSVALGQSILSSATLSGSTVFGGGTLQAQDITFVFSLPETVTVLTSTAVSLALDSTSLNPNFFEIYVGGSPATPLAGTGYNSDVGATRILAGTISASGGVYLGQDVDGDSSLIEVFDQAGGTNDYPGIYTIEGNGSTGITVQVTSFDPLYFPGGIATLSLNFNTSLVDPFRQIDPSRQFWDGTSLVAANIGKLNGGNNALAIALGRSDLVPTGCTGTGDCDFQFQADANNDFAATTVPEPATLALLGLGLIGIGFRNRAQRKQC